MTLRTLRVLIIDDAATSRCMLSDLLSEFSGVEVVGTAPDGGAGLRHVADLAPDLVLLDLQMPQMDGFTFLRLLMASRPTPVVVVSSHASRDHVFRALELGAIDFVAKPDSMLLSGVDGIRGQLQHMITVVRSLSPLGWQAFRVRSHRESGLHRLATDAAEGSSAQAVQGPLKLVVVAASTGGPAAILELLAKLPPSLAAAVLIAQHMPERFTHSFAERLDRISAFRVQEAEGDQTLEAGLSLVCPGGHCLEVHRLGHRLSSKVVPATSDDRYAPSADRLFSTAAHAAGENTIGVVLTGMGDDGARGAQAIRQAGGVVLAESEESAVVYGMPGAAARLNAVDEVLPLAALVQRLIALLS